MVTIKVGCDDANIRLDRFLRRNLAHIALSEIYRLIRTGAVRVDGRKRTGNYRLSESETIEAACAPDEAHKNPAAGKKSLAALANTRFFAENFKVLYEDDSLIACDKPSGLVVHPGSGHAGHDTLIDCARAYLVSRGIPQSPDYPFLVHRLDRDTSGIVLLAKDRQVLRTLHEALRNHVLTKRYRLVCHSRPPRQKGIIDTALVRTYDARSGTRVCVAEQGMHARSTYKVIKQTTNLCMLDVHIQTGRTHQIRVHMAHMNCPIVGDIRYGNEKADKVILSNPHTEKRLYLHAHSVSFRHPVSHVPFALTAEIPPSFARLLAAVTR